MLFLSQPAGLWALLALPAILLIHCLQERTRRVRVSTLFLLERVRPESVSGSRFDRLRSSLPLWLQLLAAVILAWILAEPRWISQKSRQTVAVVLDSSASLSAFHERLSKQLANTLGRWNKVAARTDWHLLESDPRKPPLYTGQSLAELLSSLHEFQPILGTHAPDDALQAARALVKESGLVLFVTDHEVTVPSGMGLLAVGEPIDNLGLTGFATKPDGQGGFHWEALAHNHSSKPLERNWRLIRRGEDGSTSEAPEQRLHLAPQQTLTLKGELPKGTERVELRLGDDRFALDNTLFFVRPTERPVRVALRLSDVSAALFRKMIAAMPGVELVDALMAQPDLEIAVLGTKVSGHAILVPGEAFDKQDLDPAWTVADEHRLTRDLNWMGLLTPTPVEMEAQSGDQPLLWKGPRPLAVFRAEGQRRELRLAWRLNDSNAERSPAVLILLQRFLEEIRLTKKTPWSENFETRQALPVPEDFALQVQAEKGEPIAESRAPEQPGFFVAKLEDKPLITGAASFADVREGDFSSAKEVDTAEALRVESAMRQSEEDPWWPLWLLAILACLLGSWAVKSR